MLSLGRKNERGSVAIEFAMVGPMFFALMTALFEVGFIALGNQLLMSATQEAARQVQIRAVEEGDIGKSTVRSLVCDSSLGLFDCEDIRIRLTTFEDFSAASVELSEEFPDDLEDYESFDIGEPEEIVVVRILYEWPIHLAKIFATRDNGTYLMVSTTIVRNEPDVDE